MISDANATFKCELYADYNADGRYSNATEKIGANDFTITLNGVKQPVSSKVETDETTGTQSTVYYYELSPNSYHLEYRLPDDYVGVLAVKIKVSQNNNDYRYDSEEMYFYRANTSESKIKIRVLQILPTSAYNDSEIFNMGQSGVEDGTLTESSTFYKYLNQLADYDISIVAMKASRYAELYSKNPDFLDEYDMLVLGFADCYNFLQGYTSNGKNGNFEFNEAESIAAYQGVHDFIESGKSVLFTHDTTSYGGNPKGADAGDDWGLVLNNLLPQDVGMDRYGLNDSLLLRAGIKNLSKNGTTTYNVDDYQSLKTAYDNGELTKKTYTAGELFDLIVAEAEENNKDIAYKPNSDKTALAFEVQGRSSMTINGNYWKKYSLKNVNSSYATSGLPTTTKVELLNEGQILVYPYNILSEIKSNNNIMNVQVTHGQYYQIDMNEDEDQDGESDITVWLSLTDSNTSDYSYRSASKDARNNYYIYTKGNVTYSGVGHSYIDYATNETEIKLYINTLVAAYSAGAHAPSVSIKSEPDADAADLDTVYVGMDSVIGAEGTADAGTITSETLIGEESDIEEIYFSVKDTNAARSGTKKIALEYYNVYDSKDVIPDEDKNSAVELEDGKWGVKLSLNTYAKSEDGTYTASADLSNITSGAYYKVEVPYSLVSAKDGKAATATIRIYATTSIYKGSAVKATGVYKGYDTIHVQRVSLFNLD